MRKFLFCLLLLPALSGAQGFLNWQTNPKFIGTLGSGSFTAPDAGCYRWTTDTFLCRYAAKQLSVTGDGTGATTNAGWILGYFGTSAQSGLWSSTVVPGTTNHTLFSDGGNAYVNAAVGGTVGLTVNGSPLITATGTGTVIGGHMSFSPDNTYDIGVAGATRPRTGYFGTSIISPLLTAAGTGLTDVAGGNGKAELEVVNEASGARYKLRVNSSGNFVLDYYNGAAWAKIVDVSSGGAVSSLYQRYGSGTPEGAVTAPVGTIFHRTDGGAATSLYVKESGAGNTGWVAK